MANRIKYLILLIISFTALSQTDSSFNSNMECPCFGTSLKLKVFEFTGLWYRTAGFPHYIYPNMYCEYLIINKINNNSFSYNVHQYNTTTHKNQHNNGTVIINRNIFPQTTIATSSIPGITLTNWRVLEVDYQNYALIYSCMYKFNKFLGQMFWIITRQQYPSQIEWNKIKKDVNTFRINYAQLENINQASCTAKVPNIPIPLPAVVHVHSHNN